MIQKLIVNRIILWYREFHRKLPWRETSDPYKIWLSEVILQQTRVSQGLPYYQRFIEAFPDLSSLASAEFDQVLRIWQGLGYYSRARNMLECAQILMEKYNGKFPEDYVELLKLKGIGEYTAAAIASFAFKKAISVVDGNVFRVLSRIYGINLDIATSQSKKYFQKIANDLIPEDRPDEFNQAIMEFGALQCTPKQPDCQNCTLRDYCYAFEHKAQGELPVKSKKLKKKLRYFHYLVPIEGNKIWMKKRNGADIWKGLYDFPLIEENKILDEKVLAQHDNFVNHVNNSKFVRCSKTYKHLLTHQTLFAKFFLLEGDVSKKLVATAQGRFFSPDEIRDLPKPILVDKFLRDMQILITFN